jgi:Spy/CpxP family protein refolding chaperone
VAKLQKEFQEQHKDALGKLAADFSKVRDAMRKAREDNDRDAIRQAMQDMRAQFQSFQKLRDEFDTKLSAVLTDEQKKQYDELKRERSQRGRFPGRRPNARPDLRQTEGRPGGGGLLPREIQQDLSAEQKDKLAKIQKEAEDKALSLLTDAQKKRYEELKKGRRPRDRGRPASEDPKPDEKKDESKPKP